MKQAHNVPVLMYHHVTPRAGMITASPQVFEQQIAGLARAGYRSLDTREFLGQSDIAIAHYRRLLLQAIDQAESGQRPLMVLDREAGRKIQGPMTVDGIGPTGNWEGYWRDTYAKVRGAAPWTKEPTRAA